MSAQENTAAAIAAAAWTPGNTVSIIAAVVAVVGTITVAVIQYRSRLPADARDDRTAENATLKGAAEVAMELVDRTKSWAMDLIKAMQQQIADQQQRIADLERERRELLGRIAVLEESAESSTAERAAELAAAHAREEELRRQLTEATESVRSLQAALDEAEGYGIDELTLKPETVQQRASIYAPKE